MMHIVNLELNFKKYEDILIISENAEKVKEYINKRIQEFKKDYPVWESNANMIQVSDGNEIVSYDDHIKDVDYVMALF